MTVFFFEKISRETKVVHLLNSNFPPFFSDASSVLLQFTIPHSIQDIISQTSTISC